MKGTRSTIQTAKKILGLAVLLGYIFAILPVIHIHEEKADDCHVSSIETQASNSCHNYIHHGIKTPDCEDHKHLSGEEKVCFACHHLINIKKLAVTFGESVGFPISSCQNIVSYSSSIVAAGVLVPQLRGPPSTF